MREEEDDEEEEDVHACRVLSKDHSLDRNAKGLGG